MSITDLRPLFSISYIGLKHGKEPHISGGPSTWPSRGIVRSCFRQVDHHDHQYIQNNMIINVDDVGVRWVCGNDATQCEISNNDVALTKGISTLGSIVVKDNVVLNSATSDK